MNSDQLWAILGKQLAREMGMGRAWVSCADVPNSERLNMRGMAIDERGARFGRIDDGLVMGWDAPGQTTITITVPLWRILTARALVGVARVLVAIGMRGVAGSVIRFAVRVACCGWRV